MKPFAYLEARGEAEWLGQNQGHSHKMPLAALHPQQPTSSNDTLPAEGCTASHNSVTSWRPNIRTHEPVGAFPHSNHNLLPVAPIGSQPSQITKYIQSSIKSHHSLTVPILFKVPKPKAEKWAEQGTTELRQDKTQPREQTLGFAKPCPVWPHLSCSAAQSTRLFSWQHLVPAPLLGGWPTSLASITS